MKKKWEHIKKSALILFFICFFEPFYLMSMMDPEEQMVWITQMTTERPFLDSVNLADQGPAVIASPLGVNAAPLVGRYSSEGYDFALTHLIVKLPRCQLAGFPQAIREGLIDYSDDELNLFFMILDDTYLMNGAPSRNLIFHTAAFPNAVATDNLQCECSMGLFQGQGILFLGGNESLPLDTWKSQAIIIHPAGKTTAFSPNNARFNINQEEAISSFYTAAHLPGHRATAAYIIILHNLDSLEVSILDEAQRKASLEDFLSFLIDSDLRHDILKEIKSLLLYRGNSPI